MNWLADDDMLVLFFEVDNEDLEEIKQNNDFFKNEEFIRRIDKCKGNNAVVYSLNIKNKKVKLRKWIEKALKEYDSISWWTVNHRRFFIRRRNVKT